MGTRCWFKAHNYHISDYTQITLNHWDLEIHDKYMQQANHIRPIIACQQILK